MRIFIRYVDQLNDWIGNALALLIVPMIIIVLYTAVMRYFFNTGVDWGFECALFAYGVHMIVGGAYCMKQKGHVSVDVLATALGPNAHKWIGIMGQIVVLAVVVIMVWMGTRWAWKSTLQLERSIHGTVFNPQIWWFKWGVPVSAFLIGLQSMAEIGKLWLGINEQKES